jgi:subtilisin family serine protease
VPESRLPTLSRTRQRTAIAEVRERLVDRLALSNATMRVSYATIPYVALEADEAALDELVSSDLVDGVSEDPLMAPTLASTIPLTGADRLWQQGNFGQGQTVAILDTGVEAGHSFFGGRVVSEACYSTTSVVGGSASLCPNDQSAMIGPGAASPAKCSSISGCSHGTHVAGIAAGSGSSFHGVARGAAIIAIQVFSRFNDSGACGGPSQCVLSYSSDQIAGLERVYALRLSHSIAAANLSLGGGAHTSTCDGEVPAYTAIVATLQGAGIATVIASGNTGFGSGTTFPGCLSDAVTVGAVWDDDTVPAFSNSASWVDLLAPGTNVTSSLTGGGFGIMTGTSMAAPHVTGAFALLRSAQPSATLDGIRSALVITGKSVTDPKSGIAIPRIRLDLAADRLTPPSIATLDLPPGTAGSAYFQTIVVTGGAKPLSFRKTSGAPPGLALSPTAGTLNGTPSSAGSFAFTIEVEDAIARTDVQNYLLLVKLPRPTPLNPKGSTREARPGFQWTAPPGATRYRLLVDTDSGATTLLDTIVTSTQFFPAIDLPQGLHGWRVRAFDDAANASDFTDRVEFEVDLTAPSARPLEVSPPISYFPRAIAASQSSSQFGADWASAKAFDANPSSYWSTLAQTTMTEELLRADLGAPQVIGKVKLVSRTGSGSTFPSDFEIQTSVDGSSYATVAHTVDFVASPGASYEFPFGASVARYVKLRITKTRLYGGRYYAQLAEMTIEEPRADAGALRVRWSAPGDDGNLGAASSYDLRWSTSPIQAGNFLAANPIPSIPVPAAAGSPQSAVVSGLADETSYHVALRSADDVGNLSEISTALGKTAGVPPAPIANLATTASGPTSIALRWTATGEDGFTGAAHHYEVRYSLSPLTADSFAGATLAVTGIPTPSPAGSTETMTLSGLVHTSRYYIALVVVDAALNRSALSNVLIAATSDLTPPGKPILVGAPSPGGPRPVSGVVVAVAASSEVSAGYGKERTVDGLPTSSWSSAPTSTPVPQFLQWSLPTTRSIARVRLRSRDVTGALFPVDYQIQLSTDGAAWATVASATGFSVGGGAWVTHDFPSTDAKLVKLLVSKPARYSVDGLYYAQLAEIEIFETVTRGAATLQWLAPGDDGFVGAASSHFLCFSKTPAHVSTFCSGGGAMLTLPVSGPAGTPESYLLTDLDSETRYYFSLRSADDGAPPNLGPPADVIFLDTAGIPPAPVDDLSVAARTLTTVVLSWTASGDDGTVGLADEYRFCYSTAPVTASGFCIAPGSTLLSLPATEVHPNQETTTITGLDPDTIYHFGLIVEDEIGQASTLSNAVTLLPLDRIPPGPASSFGVAGSPSTYTQVSATALSSSGEFGPAWGKHQVVDGNPATAWSTPGRSAPQEESLVLDLGAVRNIGRVRLRSRDVTGILFPTAFEIQTALVDQVASYATRVSRTSFVAAASAWYVFDFPSPGPARYLRLRVTMPARYAADGKYYVQIAEIAADEVSSNVDSLTLSWRASGDDGTLGTATSYRLCYSQNANDVASDFCATGGTLASVPVSGPAGTLERRTVTGLDLETVYHFGLKVLDEDFNASPPVIASGPTPTVPPGAVTGFTSTALSPTSIRLDWKASGDNGALGLADHYELCVSSSPVNHDFCGSWISTPVTGPAGTDETFVAGSLQADTLYYFGIRVADDLGSRSEVRALGQKTRDIIAPEAISGFSAAAGTTERPAVAVAISSSGDISSAWSKEKVLDRNDLTSWSTPPRVIPQEEFLILDLGSSRTVTGVRLRSRQETGALFPASFELSTSLVNGSYVTQVARSGFTSPAATWHELPFPAAVSARFVRLRVTGSRLYAVNNSYYVQISEMEVKEQVPRPDALALSWLAPHENGAGGGPATRYVVKMSLNPLSAANFAAAADVSGVLPLPGPAGATESFLVTGLTPATTYYFGIAAVDEESNASAPVFASRATGVP